MLTLLKFLSRIIPAAAVKKIPGAAWVYRTIYARVKPSGPGTLQWNGFQIHLDLADEGIARPLLLTGEYEPFEIETFLASIRNESAFWVVDIGANVGLYSLAAARSLKALPQAGVLAFEPSPSMRNFLIENVKNNGLTNVRVLPLAVSDQEGELSFYLDQTNLGNPSLAKLNVGLGASEIRVACSTLDQVLAEQGLADKVGLIKMDAQGAEAKVFRGAAKWLGRPNCKILFEFWPRGIQNCGDDPLEMLLSLERFGCKLSMLNTARNELVQTTPQEIMRHCNTRSLGEEFVNLLAQKPI